MRTRQKRKGAKILNCTVWWSGPKRTLHYPWSSSKQASRNWPPLCSMEEARFIEMNKMVSGMNFYCLLCLVSHRSPLGKSDEMAEGGEDAKEREPRQNCPLSQIGLSPSLSFFPNFGDGSNRERKKRERGRRKKREKREN